MSTMPTIVPASPELEALFDAFLTADREAKAAADRAAELKDRLKVAMIDARQAADPADPLTNIVLQHGAVKASLKYVETWRVDATRLKAEQPAIYAAFAKKSASLTMRVGVN